MNVPEAEGGDGGLLICGVPVDPPDEGDDGLPEVGELPVPPVVGPVGPADCASTMLIESEVSRNMAARVVFSRDKYFIRFSQS
jgi:hypothetical protein